MISEYAKAIAAIVVAVAIAAAAATGYEHGYGVAKTRGDLALQQYQGRQQKADADAERKADERFTAEVLRGNEAAQDLITAHHQIDQLTNLAKGQIDVVTQNYRPAPNAALQPVPECVFTRGFVRLWNVVAGTTGSADSVPAGTAASGTDPAAAADDALDSGVSQADVLDWFTDYANANGRTVTQLNKVLDLDAARQTDAALPVTPASDSDSHGTF